MEKRALRAGAMGYVMKSEPARTVLRRDPQSVGRRCPCERQDGQFDGRKICAGRVRISRRRPSKR